MGSGRPSGWLGDTRLIEDTMVAPYLAGLVDALGRSRPFISFGEHLSHWLTVTVSKSVLSNKLHVNA